MRVRVPHVPDRLARKEPLRFGDDGKATRFALAAFEHDDVIREFDGERDVAAGDPPDALGELLGAHLSRGAARRRPASERTGCGRGRREKLGKVRRIRDSLDYPRLEGLRARAVLDDASRYFHAAEVAIVAVEGLDAQVS